MVEQEERVAIAIQAVKQAGVFVKEGFENLSINLDTKSNTNDIVTKYDIKSQETIISHIRKYYPHDQIIGEEQEMNDKGQHTAWVIDPIDGTNPFSRKMTTFGIIVGYMVNYKAQFCVMFNPVTNELYIAESQKGASLNGHKLHIAHREFKNQLVNTEAYRLEKRRKFQLLLQPYIYSSRSMSCSCYSTMEVIRGQSDAFISYADNIWDRIHYLFLVEAGAKVTNHLGEEYTLKEKDYIGCHPSHHKKYIDILRTVLSKLDE